LHLTHYLVAVWIVLLALLARPMLTMVDPGNFFWCLLTGWTMMIFSSLAPPLTYGYARYVLGGRWSGLKTVPAMMVLGTGLSVNNALAVWRGLRTRGGEFVRTPKSGSTQAAQSASRYKPVKNAWMWFVEMLIGAYCLAYFAIYVTSQRPVFGIFLGIYAAAFLTIGWMSRPEANLPRRVLVLGEPEGPVPPAIGSALAPAAGRV
jgi:hypothetical protein